MTVTEPSLKSLRDEIAEVDCALLELLRRRMDLAAEVGRIKAAAGAPIVVRDVEDRVLHRARQNAEACGVSEQVLEAIFAAIIRGSVERQHRVGIALRERRGVRVLIVGGAGGMGSWFQRFFEIAGHGVDLVDPAFASRPPERGRFADLAEIDDLDVYAAVLVAVPLASTGDVIEQIAARTPGGTVVEIASIKDPVAGALARSRDRGARVLSLHPMFGPGKSPYEPLTFLLATQEDPAAERRALEPLLTHPYTRLIDVPLPHHDRLMSWLLGLSHLVNILFGTALTRSGLDPRELYDCASTTFLRQATTALYVLSENPELYLDIQHLNPYRGEVFRAARESLEQVESLVEARDREGFSEALAIARRAMAGER